MGHRTQRSVRRWIVAMTTAAALCTGLAFAGGAPAMAGGDEAAAFVEAINASRASLAGASALEVHGDLARVAADHAAAMAAKGSIYHNPSLGQQVTGWEVVGENVGVGPDVDTLHQAFLDSPSHRANLLDGRYREIGIGIVRTNNQLWVVEVFRKPVPAAPAPAPQPAQAPAPVPAPVIATAPAPAKAPAPAPVSVAAPVAEPVPAPPVPVAEVAPVLATSTPSADELADQSGARWGSPVTPAPLELPVFASSAAAGGAGRTSAPIDGPALAALVLWLLAAGLVTAQVRRSGLDALLPARGALQPA